MKRITTIRVLVFFIGIATFSSCLEGDPVNFPEGANFPIMQMAYSTDGASYSYAGMKFFANQSLVYPPTVTDVTMQISVQLQGVSALNKDIKVTLASPTDALDDYYRYDSIIYQMMPASYYNLGATTGTIKAGESYVTFDITFHPNLFDGTKNFMLPITATNDQNIPMSSNNGFVYFHLIGNPISGAYNWDFIRCSTPTCSNGPDGLSFYNAKTTFSPVNPTTVRVKMGYYTQPDYIISFKDNGGVLSNFKVEIDPAAISAWKSAGIQVVTGPTITPANNNTKFTINFTTLTRNCTDIYYK